MDVRLSGEQLALRDSAARVVDQLGPHAVGQLDDAERTGKLDAAVTASGWRELRTANDDGRPWASTVEVALVAEELGRGLADAAFFGPTLAAELRRVAGLDPGTRVETVGFNGDLGSLGDAVAVDAAGAAGALVLDGRAIGEVALGADRVRVDLTRPSVRIEGAAMPLGDIGVAELT